MQAEVCDLHATNFTPWQDESFSDLHCSGGSTWLCCCAKLPNLPYLLSMWQCGDPRMPNLCLQWVAVNRVSFVVYCTSSVKFEHCQPVCLMVYHYFVALSVCMPNCKCHKIMIHHYTDRLTMFKFHTRCAIHHKRYSIYSNSLQAQIGHPRISTLPHGQ